MGAESELTINVQCKCAELENDLQGWAQTRGLLSTCQREQIMLYRNASELIPWPQVHRAPMEEAAGKGKEAEGSGRDDPL